MKQQTSTPGWKKIVNNASIWWVRLKYVALYVFFIAEDREAQEIHAKEELLAIQKRKDRSKLNWNKFHSFKNYWQVLTVWSWFKMPKKKMNMLDFKRLTAPSRLSGSRVKVEIFFLESKQKNKKKIVGAKCNVLVHWSCPMSRCCPNRKEKNILK